MQIFGRPPQSLGRALEGRPRVWLGVIAGATLAERLLVVATALQVVQDRPLTALILLGVLSAVFLGRRVARALLRVDVQSRLIAAVSEKALADDLDLTEP